MQFPAALRARNPQLAATTAFWLLVSGVVLSIVLACVPWLAVEQRLVPLACGLGYAALAVVYRLVPPVVLDRYGIPLGALLVCLLSIAVLMTVTQGWADLAPTMTLLTLLWAGVCLRTRAAWVAATTAIVSFAASAVTVLDPVNAVAHILFLSAAAILMTTVLARTLDNQAALTKKLTDIAGLDALTGLATRRAFDEAVGIALTGHAEEKGTALVLVDLDRFKTINDVHGHPVGDRALQHVSAILRGSVRARDSVVGRLGGDELAVLLAGCPVDVAERRARDLWEAIRNTPLELADGTTLQLTVSVGVAHAPPSGLGAGELYAAADGALYAAKRGGRDTVAVAG